MNPQQPFDPNQRPYDPNQPPVYPPAPSPYGQQQGYQQTPYGGGPSYLPSANGGTILALGIAAFFCFGIILGPIAWVMGNSALALIDSGQANPAERSNVAAGRICGIIATALSVVGLIAYGIYFAVIMASVGSHLGTPGVPSAPAMPSPGQ
jgi:hypothetical protein